jgi:Flp pilus assembly protein TadG
MHFSPTRRRDVASGRPPRDVRRRHSVRGQSLVEFALVVPLLLIFFVAVADFARLYATMSTIESAAREAADYGSFESAYWTDEPGVRAHMTHRACLASSTLPDYVGTTDDSSATCSNPSVAISLDPPDSVSCANSTREPPCRVTATLTFDFHLILPLHLDFGGGRSFGFPDHLTFQRSSTFAMTDLQLNP